MRAEWTYEELEAMKAGLLEGIERTERENPNIRPLPPLEEGEARSLLQTLAETATYRLLTVDEEFLVGQLLSVFRMAVIADAMGKKGRYFVVSREDMERVAKRMS